MNPFPQVFSSVKETGTSGRVASKEDKSGRGLVAISTPQRDEEPPLRETVIVHPPGFST